MLIAMMRFMPQARALTLGSSFAACMIAAAVMPRPAVAAEMTAVLADRMTAACMVYAKEHRGAVNIWVYDSTGQVVHFERMDGAPGIGSPPGSPSQSGAAFGSAIDPDAFDPADPGDVPIRLGGEIFGRVRVAGMGPAGDRACALAAATVAK